MSLHVYFPDMGLPKDKKVINNGELLWLTYMDTFGSDLDKTFLDVIEHGSYLDRNRFNDRFGGTLRLDDMSTGCKVACTIPRVPDDIIVDMIECGDNVQSAVASYCTSGNVLFNNEYWAITTTHDFPIDIILSKYRFTSAYRYNMYILEEMGVCDPDMTVEGIECIV